jgi:hypothetical protein
LLGYLPECSVDKTVDRKTRKAGFTRAGECYAVTFKRLDRIKLQVVVVDELNEKVGVEVSTTQQGSEKGVCCFHTREGVREIQALLLLRALIPNAVRWRLRTTLLAARWGTIIERDVVIYPASV